MERWRSAGGAGPGGDGIREEINKHSAEEGTIAEWNSLSPRDKTTDPVECPAPGSPVCCVQLVCYTYLPGPDAQVPVCATPWGREDRTSPDVLRRKNKLREKLASAPSPSI
ncbi:hypothetical protein Bbelb_208130 [Branchiostoma belcheri]|nr:hypothetical protein Bbelb_208130 [Branchiostoma belcheri]